MKYSSVLWRVGFCVVLSHLVMGFMMFIFGYLSALVAEISDIHSVLQPMDSGYLSMMYSWIFGFPGVVLLVFVYALLVYKEKNYLIAILIGCSTPGLIVLVFNTAIGIVTLICGIFVGVATHVAFAKIFSNKSFKRTPLRGAA